MKNENVCSLNSLFRMKIITVVVIMIKLLIYTSDFSIFNLHNIHVMSKDRYIFIWKILL